MGPIVLLTDFGARDGYVGIMKGVIAKINAEAKVIDLSHDLPPQDIKSAGFVLWNSYRYFPIGSTFVCVVDPGVGSERKILAIQTEHYQFLVPDNGLMDFVLAETPCKLQLSVENPAVFRDPGAVSQTFHGRDIFAPAAAHLSRGFPFTQLGPILPFQLPASPFLQLENGPNSQQVRLLHLDHFGNVITNLRLPNSPSPQISVAVEGEQIPLVKAYADVEPGELLAIRGSHGLLELAVREGNAADYLGRKFQMRSAMKATLSALNVLVRIITA